VKNNQRLNDFIFIEGGNRDSFHLNKTSGALYSKTKFDYETVQFYEVLIRATENCTCEILSSHDEIIFCEDLNEISYDAIGDLSRIKIKLKIIDVNDNEPYFTKKFYRLGLTTDVSYGETILQGFVSSRFLSRKIIFAHELKISGYRNVFRIYWSQFYTKKIC
jgi:hypothetical protein